MAGETCEHCGSLVYQAESITAGQNIFIFIFFILFFISWIAAVFSQPCQPKDAISRQLIINVNLV